MTLLVYFIFILYYESDMEQIQATFFFFFKQLS